VKATREQWRKKKEEQEEEEEGGERDGVRREGVQALSVICQCVCHTTSAPAAVTHLLTVHRWRRRWRGWRWLGFGGGDGDDSFIRRWGYFLLSAPCGTLLPPLWTGAPSTLSARAVKAAVIRARGISAALAVVIIAL